MRRVRQIFCVMSILLFTFFGMTGASMAGSGFTEQGNALYQALTQHLIAQGICKDNKTCHDAHQIYSEDGGGRIYFNMYGQKDKTLTSMIAGFLVANGLRITGGMPITLSVFEAPKTLNMGFIAGIVKKETTIKLEINK